MQNKHYCVNAESAFSGFILFIYFLFLFFLQSPTLSEIEICTIKLEGLKLKSHLKMSDTAGTEKDSLRSRELRHK